MEKQVNAFTLWNPQSAFPPKRTYKTFKAAENVAEMMAKKNPNETFYVVGLVTGIAATEKGIERHEMGVYNVTLD